MDWSTVVNISCKIKAENSSSKLHGAREDIYFDFCLLFPVSHKSILTLSCTIFWLVYNHINTSWECNQQWQDIMTWRKAVLQGVGKFITRRSEKKRYTPIAQVLKREISYGLNLERFQLSRLRKASDIMFFRHHIRNGRECVCVKYYRIASIESYNPKGVLQSLDNVLSPFPEKHSFSPEELLITSTPIVQGWTYNSGAHIWLPLTSYRGPTWRWQGSLGPGGSWCQQLQEVRKATFPHTCPQLTWTRLPQQWLKWKVGLRGFAWVNFLSVLSDLQITPHR